MAFRSLIIGTGFGSRVVAGCYAEAGMSVTVVTPRDAAAVRAACAEPFDLVSVHSPPFLHAEHVNLALDHGRNVLCDKPFGVSAAEAKQMLARAREKGVVHLLMFEFRCDPARSRVKQIVDSGEIGRITHVNWSFFNGFAPPSRPYGWQFDAERGGGWIRINSTHQIDAIRWLVGEIDAVECRTRIDVKERRDKEGKAHRVTAEDGFVANLKTANGASVLIDTSWAAPGNLPDRWTLIGTDGAIEVTEKIILWADPMVRDSEVRVVAAGKERVERFGPFPGDAHLPSMRPWAVKVREAVSARRQIAPSFEDGVAASEVVDKLLAASRRQHG
jgi:predicted dehydrogenase